MEMLSIIIDVNMCEAHSQERSDHLKLLRVETVRCWSLSVLLPHNDSNQAPRRGSRCSVPSPPRFDSVAFSWK